MKAECKSCVYETKCKVKKSYDESNEICDNWEGNCDYCVDEGKPLFNCPDCDWDEYNDDEDEDE